jgi:hypothetical protein
MSKIEKYIKILKPNISQNSLKQYTSNISSVLNHLNYDIDDFTKDDILNNIDKIYNFLKKTYNGSTLRNKLNAFIIILKHEDKKDDYNKFSTLRDELQEEYKNKATDNKFSDSEKQNYVSSDEYKKLLTKLRPTFNKLTKKTNLNIGELNEIIDYIILLFYFHFNLRSDLTYIKIITKNNDDNKKDNYLLWSRTKKQLILNEYKTARKNGSLFLDITDKNMINDLNQYINKIVIPYKFNYLIMNIGLTDSIVPSSLSTRFSTIFKKYLNKNFTINLNRKRHISENPDYKKYNELKDKLTETAKNAGNSIGVASTIYFKKNV